MALTIDEFNKAIRRFFEESNRLHDQWQLIEVREDLSYLVKTSIDEKCLKSEFHIVYSESYSVPVVYFNVSRLDGSLLSADDIWQMFEHRNSSNRHETISQCEHPIVHRPFFFIHPCRTELFLKTLADRSSFERFLFWLSVYGQSVGLTLSNEYGIFRDE